MHFYMAALLTLSDAELARVMTTMREQGATVEVGPLPAGPKSVPNAPGDPAAGYAAQASARLASTL